MLLPDTVPAVPRPAASDALHNVAVCLPATGSILLGRAQELQWLDRALSCGQTHIVSVVAWGGVGKSTLVNHWLGTLAQNGWHEVQYVFGWTFSSQGIEDPVASADEFFDAALRFFGDPEPRLGTSWAKGHRLAQLVYAQRTLLVLDGLETLQHPPGPQAGQLTDPAMVAFLQFWRCTILAYALLQSAGSGGYCGLSSHYSGHAGACRPPRGSGGVRYCNT